MINAGMMLPAEQRNSGIVLEIQRMSTEDGPGLRTTVFMKGCPMRCLWCHNPESISPKPQIHWIGPRCIGCETCIAACPEGNLSMDATGLRINREACDGCGKCADACPTNALELLGKEWEVRALVDELLKDREYFKQSNGGITISGGESTLQWKFVAELARLLKEEGIHICMDTCGLSKKEVLRAILPFTDIVLFDLKEMDPQLHHQFTGSDLEKVLAGFSCIVDFIRLVRPDMEIWIRTPVIPGATDRAENIQHIGKEIHSRGKGTVTRWDLLAFNNLCKDKYQRLGLSWQYKDIPLMRSEEMELLAGVARQSGVDPGIVKWSGSTRLEDDEVEVTPPAAKQKAGGCG